MDGYNVDLLMQVREKIVNEPEKHDQMSWARALSDPRKGGDCGTAYCVAGWAAVLDGQEMSWAFSPHANEWRSPYLANGQAVWRYAQEALGLDSSEEGTLFDGDNSRESVLDMLDRLIEAGKNGERVPDGGL